MAYLNTNTQLSLSLHKVTEINFILPSNYLFNCKYTVLILLSRIRIDKKDDENDKLLIK